VEWTWDASTLETALSDGLRAWRLPDSRGLACASCHQPEPIDFAVLGITDEQIRAHAQAFASPEVIAATTLFVHALRRRENLKTVCAASWSPLQPDNAVLESDEAFAQQLRARGLRIVTGPVQTLNEARSALSEIDNIDVRSLRLALALPPWSAVGDLNDWSNWAPPIQLNELFALHDAWLAQHSEESVRALETFLVAQAAPAARFPAPSALDPRWLQSVSARKHAAAFRFTHQLMEATRGRAVELGPKHALALAQATRLNPCHSDACELTSLDALPFELADDHREGLRMDEAALDLSQRWHVVALLQDVTLLHAPTSPPLPGTHFGIDWRWPLSLRGFHEPVLHLVRLAAQQRALAPAMAGAAPYPDDLSMRPPPLGVRSLWVDGGYLVVPGLHEVPDDSAGDWTGAARLRLNVFTVILELQRDSLLAGTAVAERATLIQFLFALETFLNELRDANRIRLQQRKEGLPSDELTAATTRLENLRIENEALVMAATEAP
jgi:hypothetical protein